MANEFEKDELTQSGADVTPAVDDSFDSLLMGSDFEEPEEIGAETESLEFDENVAGEVKKDNPFAAAETAESAGEPAEEVIATETQTAEAPAAETAVAATAAAAAADIAEINGTEVPAENAAPKSKRQIKKELKKKKSLYHVSNWDIIKHYRTYNDAEKKHYRYIFGRRISTKVWPVFRFFILFGLAFVIMTPILYMISCAVRPQTEMVDPSVMWIPKTFITSNITEVWDAIKYPDVVLSTILINVGCSLIQVVTCSITGYGFARFKFKFKGLLFGIVILQIIVPIQVILIPQFMQFRYFDPLGICSLITGEAINLADSPAALYMQAFFCNGIRAGLFILLFRQFFRGLPKELEDAAYLDGCGPVETFVRIMVPNARSSFLTVFIFSVVWYWNDSYVSGMFFSNSKTIALEVENLYTTISQYFNGGTPTGTPSDWLVWIEAGCLLSILPILIMYIFLQKQFVEGVERSGIVG